MIQRSTLWPILAAIAALLPAQYCLADAAAASTGTAPAASSAAQHTRTPWWFAFGDAALNLLVAEVAHEPSADRDSVLQRQAVVTSEYVKSRVYTSQLNSLRELAATSERQMALLRQTARADGEDAKAVSALERETTLVAQQVDQFRTASLQQLATVVGALSVDVLTSMIAPALNDARLPLPAFKLPTSVPGLVLRQRADVARAEAELALGTRRSGDERLRLAHYLQALASSIEPESHDRPPHLVDGPRLEPEEILEVARVDVADKLWRLSAAATSAVRQRELQQQAERRWQAVRGLVADGPRGEWDELAARRDLLIQEGRLASAAGELALAWIAHQYSIGGAGDATISALLDTD